MMDKRLMGRIPGAGVAAGLGAELGKGAKRGAGPAAFLGQLEMLNAIPMDRTPTATDRLRFGATGAKATGRVAAHAAGGAFSQLVRPDGAIKRVAGGVSGSLKRYIPK